MNKAEALAQLAASNASLAVIQNAAAGTSQAIKDLRDSITEAVLVILADDPIPDPPDPPSDPTDFEQVITITDAMSLSTITATLSALPDNSLVLVEGVIPWFYIGGNNQNRGVYRSDTEPYANVTFRGNNASAALSLRFVDNVGGYENLFFENLKFQPGSENQFAPVLCENNTTGGFLSFTDCTFESPYTSFYGFGMKWGAVMVGNRWEFVRCTFDAAQEHSVYDKNGQGDRLLDTVANNTMDIDIIGGASAGTTFNGGNGRTLWQSQERIVDGPPGFGTLTVRNCVASKCGHEGKIFSGTPQGGGAYTIGGGVTDFVMTDSGVDAPYGSSLVIWKELDEAKDVKGYGTTACSTVTVTNFAAYTGSKDPNRPAFILGAFPTGVLSGITLDGVAITPPDSEILLDGDAQYGIPLIQSLTWT